MTCRLIAGLSLAALAACASPPPAAPQVVQAKIEAGQVYQSLRLQEVEQRMLFDDSLLTYADAAVSCGLRGQQWLTLVHGVYAQDFAAELQQVPLNAQQRLAALNFADAHVESPSPPPYICGRLQQDSTLAGLDQAVGLQALEVVSAR